MRAVMTNGLDFNTRVGNLDPNPAYYSDPTYSIPTKPSIKYFKRSRVAPQANITSINIEDSEKSDYEIKAWYNVADQAVYYYAEPNVVFLNEDSRWMFRWFTKMETIDLAGFDTSEVTTMYCMFYMMNSLKSIDVSGFNTSRVTDMNSMFDQTGVIEELNLSSFDTSNVTDMKWMFYGLNSMFSQMSGLTILDISNFETPSLENAGSMFAIDPGFSDNLEKIYVNQDFDTSKLTTSTNAFIRRNRLRGGNGSYLSDPSTADKTWLRVDRPGAQGYFTRKS